MTYVRGGCGVRRATSSSEAARDIQRAKSLVAWETVEHFISDVDYSKEQVLQDQGRQSCQPFAHR